MTPQVNNLHDISANLVNSMRCLLQIYPSNMNEKLANKHVFFTALIPLMLITLELLRSRNGSEVTPELNGLHDILANLVN